MKLGYKKHKITTGVEFTFTTFPDKQDKLFQKKINQIYFDGFEKQIKSSRSILYKPLKIYLLGDYDACYITFINNFKFSHRLFAPRTKSPVIFKSNSSQSYCGFCLNTDNDIESVLTKARDKYLVGIINLKLNNGFLIGNGVNFIEYSIKCLNNILGDKSFFIAHTFTWFDLSLVVFIDNPDELSSLIRDIRSIELSSGDSESIIDNSLYNTIVTKKTLINSFSIFSDSNSYLGFNPRLVEQNDKSKFVKKFLTVSNAFNIDTEIEWLVKPGHETHLKNIFFKHEELKDKFNFTKSKMSLGKYDLIISQKHNDLSITLHLIRSIFEKDKYGLFDHIRKVRTRIFLYSNFIEKEDRNYFSWDEFLSKLSFNQKELSNIEKKLKSLKISRQVRHKIIKIFINYNNGIQDPIQFPYFLDFTLFVTNLKDLIIDEYKKSRKKTSPIKSIETLLVEHIKIFQDGYYVRFLNGYQFENISDFNLDFNSSIPQLLSSYNTLIYEYGNLFYNKESLGQLIQLNNIDTVSNYRSINYSIQHLTSPEFVFSTISKEILNNLKSDNKLYKLIMHDIKRNLETFLTESNESYLDDLIDHGLFDVDYFIIDAIRYIITFQFNFELFNYWFWTYNYQNSSLFETGGMINEDQLRLEMLRIIMIKEYFKVDSTVENPSPELFTLWDRHFNKLCLISGLIVKYLKENKVSEIIDNVVATHLNQLIMNENLHHVRLSSDGINVMYSNSMIRNNTFDKILDDSDSTISMRGMIKFFHETLKSHFIKNNQRINLLRRDWLNGEILQNHKLLYENILYSIDQTGSIFFYDSSKMDEYFEQNAYNIITLIDFALISKKKFIEKLL